MKVNSSNVTWNNRKVAQPNQFSLLLSRLDQEDQHFFLQPSTAPQINFERVLGTPQRPPKKMQNFQISQQEQYLAGTDNLSVLSDSITAKSEYCVLTEHLFSKPGTENIFILQTPNQACHDTQKEQIVKYNKSKSNHEIQQQSLQAFAEEIDKNPSKNFNSGSQNRTQFPTNATSCPQPTKNQSSVVAALQHYNIRSTHMQRMLSK